MITTSCWLLNIIPVYEDTAFRLATLLLVKAWLLSGQALVSEAAVYLLVQIFVWSCALISLGSVHRVLWQFGVLKDHHDRFRFIPNSMAEIGKAGCTAKPCRSGWGARRALIYCLKEQYDTVTTSENSLAVSYTGKHLPRLYPVIMLLGIYPRELKAYNFKKKCKNMYSSFIHNSQTWKQYKCPISTPPGEWV